jgi:hypothetical protein
VLVAVDVALRERAEGVAVLEDVRDPVDEAVAERVLVAVREVVEVDVADEPTRAKAAVAVAELVKVAVGGSTVPVAVPVALAESELEPLAEQETLALLELEAELLEDPVAVPDSVALAELEEEPLAEPEEELLTEVETLAELELVAEPLALPELEAELLEDPEAEEDEVCAKAQEVVEYSGVRASADDDDTRSRPASKKRLNGAAVAATS